jgi:hypothetical protein
VFSLGPRTTYSSVVLYRLPKMVDRRGGPRLRAANARECTQVELHVTDGSNTDDLVDRLSWLSILLLPLSNRKQRSINCLEKPPDLFFFFLSILFFNP